MKAKTESEEKAAIRQVGLLNDALGKAKATGEAWLNPRGMLSPRIYPKGPAVSPFNALVLQLQSDKMGYSSSQFMFFHNSAALGTPVQQKEHGVPFNWYDWSKYQSRTEPEKTISKADYEKLTDVEKAGYKPLRQRQIRQVFNVDQTLLPLKDQEKYKDLIGWMGTANDRGNLKNEEKQTRAGVNRFIDAMRQCLVPIRREPSSVAHYDSGKDAIYMPDQKKFADYPEYVQELMRQVVAATGHQQRLAREGMLMKGGQTLSPTAEKYERLVEEVASALKMSELGLPAKLSPQNIQYVDYWTRELQENPCMLDALETDVNQAIDVIRKAEKGEKVEYAKFRTQEQIEELKPKPQVNSREAAILCDIIRHSGMAINDGNFTSQAERAEFLDKFNLYSYDKALQESLAMTGNEDPEIRDTAWTEAQTQAARIMEACMEYLPDKWNSQSKHYVISELSHEVPRESDRSFLVVKDTKSGIYDVVLPDGAMAGGHVVFPDGTQKLYRVTPDEIMTQAERAAAGASLKPFSMTGYPKEKIEAALRRDGASYVRFYNQDGKLALRPDDGWYDGKTVHEYQWKGNKLNLHVSFDTSEAVKNATNVLFDRVNILKDDNGKWALYLKPKDEPSFCIYPDREDVNRFFSTLRQGNQPEADAIRMEMGQKYYAMAAKTPNLKFDIFARCPEGVDISRISRVNIYKNREDKLMCAVKIEGMDYIQAREISREEWNRMFVAEDMSEYKTNLAAKVFEDILNPEKKKEEVVDNSRDESEHREFHKELDEGEIREEHEHRDYHEEEKQEEVEHSRGRCR